MSQILKGSCKLEVLKLLVNRLIQSKFRLVIFSQSVKMIQIILRVLPSTTLSITGSTPQIERQQTIQKFNSGFGSVLVLSTKVGGVGITLTSATRAIIYEPSWNPADDRQAVDRIYRIGQKKPCTIYRFCAAGTVEERMYEKQVFKDGLRRSVFTGDNPDLERYHGKEELKDLFTLGEGEKTMHRSCLLTTTTFVLTPHSPPRLASLAAGKSRFVDYVKSRETNKVNNNNTSPNPTPVKSIHSTPFRTEGVTPIKSKLAWTPKQTPTKSKPVSTPVTNVKGGTGKRTFLESHPQVVGVTAHDNLYVKKDNTGTPFGKNNASTPKKAEGKEVEDLTGMMGGLKILGKGGITEKKKR
ncbi:hypothetical protein TL16_g09955 [Triparma laevis f. inornata]|uniref:Helicase C-terminal domain-containing protein n=1 Tax=Triparma laevis f. inornata TaxID=1714386 RepID=A0A9W7B9J1_9STRA|nr:hypothetical protein TL16_g09955 [Triparma laevis f. inornata]